MTRTIKESSDNRFIALTALGPGYAWLQPALAAEAARRGLSTMEAARDLLAEGLESAQLDRLWCLRDWRERRGELPKIWLNAETMSLKAQLEAATDKFRARHLARWQESAALLAPSMRRAKSIQTFPYQPKTGAHGVVIAAAGLRLPAVPLDRVTACMTDDISRADVIRAVLAQRLASNAPKGWGRARRVIRIAGGDSPGPETGPSDKIYNVHCLPPFDGLPDALEKWATKKGLTKAASVVALVERGLANGIPERIPRTVSGQQRSTIIQQVPIDGDLGARLAAADARADEAHLKRTAAACADLLEQAELAIMATAHRARSDVHGDGLFVCMAGDFDQEMIDAATRYAPRVARAELVRALLAEQLERDGCLKRGWRDSASPAPLVKLPSMNDLDSIEI